MFSKKIKIGLVVLVLFVILGLGGRKMITGIPIMGVQSCGEEYNNALDSALEEKDLSFCLDKNYIPNTIVITNGITSFKVCKNSKRDMITIGDESCVESFAIFNKQPQLCSVFDELAFDGLSYENKEIVQNYLKTNKFPRFQGFSLNCAYEYNRVTSSIEGCEYLNNSIDYTKFGEGMGWSDKEMCLSQYLSCDDYEYRSPTIRLQCGQSNDKNIEENQNYNTEIGELIETKIN